MAFKLNDRVWESSTSTGIGNFVLSGTKTGYRTFSSVLADGDTCFYTIVADNGLWETGLGTYNSGTNSLTRTARYDNSSGTTATINFAAGAKEVFLSLPANSYLDTSGSLASNSDVKVPSQKAVKTYVDNKVEGSPFRNRIMNGDFLINQRRGTDAITLTFSAYNADRWVHHATQSSKASSQVINGGSVVGSTNYLRMKTVSAATLGSDDAFSIMQNIEGLNLQDFNFGTASAVQITLSFWVRASQTGTYSVSFRNGDYNRSYVTTYTINTANTWEYKTITINGDTSGTWKTDIGAGLSVYFDFGSGSTFTTSSTNTWLAGNFVKSSGTESLITTLNATLDLALVQLEKGGVATPFEYIHVADSLARCARYYQKCIANTRGYSSGSGVVIETPIQFRAQMRVVPTAALTPGTRGNISSVKISNPSVNGARHEVSSVGAGDTYALVDIVVFDAEL